MRKGTSPGQSVTKIHRQYILNELRAGRYVTEIAAGLGVGRTAISTQLARQPDYKAAREAGARRRILTLARARKGSREHRWANMRYISDFGPTIWAVERGLCRLNIVKLAEMRLNHGFQTKPSSRGQVQRTLVDWLIDFRRQIMVSGS